LNYSLSVSDDGLSLLERFYIPSHQFFLMAFHSGFDPMFLPIPSLECTSQRMIHKS
jgi:hypothetical protein